MELEERGDFWAVGSGTAGQPVGLGGVEGPFKRFGLSLVSFGMRNVVHRGGGGDRACFTASNESRRPTGVSRPPLGAR
ncbi:hypothetical protein FRC05_008155, partial [Tulasnella sp. 425]